MVRLLCVILLAIALPGPAAATAEPETPVVVHLTDGTVLPGLLVEETPAALVLDHRTLGRLEITRGSIERVERPGADSGRAHWKDDPSANSILFTPTPATLPRGTGYFRSIELLFLNFGYAPTDAFNVAVGTVFPITDELIGIMAGAKLRLIDREEHPVGLALAGSYTYLDDLQDDALWTATAVLGIGDSRRSLNLAVGGNFSGSDTNGLVMVGADYQVSARTKFIVEFGNSTSALFEEDDFNGLMNLGFRFFGDSMSFTLTGFRPLEESGGLFLFPLAVFSINF